MGGCREETELLEYYNLSNEKRRVPTTQRQFYTGACSTMLCYLLNCYVGEVAASTWRLLKIDAYL